MSKLQSEPPISGNRILKAKRSGSLNSVIFTGANHDFPSQEFFPINLAPSSAPFEPFTHLPPSFSGDQRPMLGKSVMSSQTFVGLAAISFETLCFFSIRAPYKILISWAKVI